jgi:hypothetical protein
VTKYIGGGGVHTGKYYVLFGYFTSQCTFRVVKMQKNKLSFEEKVKITKIKLS